jgi:integrase
MSRVASRNPEWRRIEATLLRRKPTLTAATLEQYELAARMLQGYRPTRMSQRQLDAVRDAVLAKYTRNSIRTLLTCIRAILRHVYKRRVTGRPELVVSRTILLLPVPRYRKKEDPVYSVAQTASMEKVIVKRKTARVHAMWRLMYDGQMRIGEICNLNDEDIDIEGRTVLVRDGKGGKDRRVMVTTEAIDAIVEWWDERQQLRDPKGVLPPFKDSDGQATFITNRNTGIWRRVKRRSMTWQLQSVAAHAHAPRRATPHLMRATGATHMLNYKGNPEVVRKNMGHKNIETTMLYNRVPEEEARINFDATWEGIRKRSEVESTDDILRSAARAFHRREISADTLERIMKNLKRAKGSLRDGSSRRAGGSRRRKKRRKR